jgi:CubicO group peptidase (beta-lactamase class C family)
MKSIEAAILREIEHGTMAGAVTLVCHKGEIVHGAANGWRDIAGRQPMTRGSVFRIASMTKPLVSLATLMLMEENRLRLDDPVTKWLPEFRGMRVLSNPEAPLSATLPVFRDITVEDLLTHRSGLAASYTVSGPIATAYSTALPAARTAQLSPESWLTAIAALPLVHPPGAEFLYGHSTDVLGILLSRAEGKPLSVILRNRIFEPLGMDNTSFWLPHERRNNLAHTYRAVSDDRSLEDITPPLPDQPPAFESGSSGLFSTADDYLRFAQLLLNDGRIDGVRLLRPETLTLMRTNRLSSKQRLRPVLGLPDFWAAQGFGLGLAQVLTSGVDPMLGPASVGSFGWPGAYGTWWLADPTEKLILIYLVQDFFGLTPETVGDMISPRRPGARQTRLIFQQLAYAGISGSVSPFSPDGA